jgi:alpha-N-arabinofuranosidase
MTKALPAFLLRSAAALSWLVMLASPAPGIAAGAPPATIAVDLDQPGKPISPDLFGIFFEDINYAADGGLYAELVQNRSFEYEATEQPAWGPLTGWEFIQRDGGAGELWVDASSPLHANNRHCALLRIKQVGAGVGLANGGFDGIPVKAGESYNFSLFARLLHVGDGRESRPLGKLTLRVRLETKEGAALGEASVEASDPAEWKRLSTTLTASQTVPDARLVILAMTPGLIALDEISLFPQKTFKGRANGLRADLAQTIADLHPKFMRFPGGCLVHGDGLGNIYRWKDTIGPVEQRKGQANIWRYHQSVGLGYFEYFQFCEDIGAQPLPVLAAGVSCQNSTRTRGTGQQCIPLADMPAYVQEVLDLIEWANGPATSTWGAQRAAAGHAAPFGLKYLGIGNEDKITPEFQERFRMIHDALKAKHPEITVIGTVGPSPSGEDFDAGWKFATEQHVAMVDEHYYEKPEWFLANVRRYDRYDRAKPAVYIGEYASWGNTLGHALAEAAYMIGLERNGDVVRLASYAPLLAKGGHTQWRVDLIYFTNTVVQPSVNYHVQQLFATNAGDRWLEPVLTDVPADLAMSVVRDSRTGEVICKIVNTGATAQPVHFHWGGVRGIMATATKTVLTGDPKTANDSASPTPIIPVTTTIAVAASFDDETPANSLTVIRIKTH